MIVSSLPLGTTKKLKKQTKMSRHGGLMEQ